MESYWDSKSSYILTSYPPTQEGTHEHLVNHSPWVQVLYHEFLKFSSNMVRKKDVNPKLHLTLALPSHPGLPPNQLNFSGLSFHILDTGQGWASHF